MSRAVLQGRPFTALVSAVLLMAVASAAAAQATRTWVSSTGDDSNPCSRALPCHSLAGAIPKTAAGGEIDIVDTTSLGSVNITKSITISAVGPLGGITAAAGSSGINVNAAATDTVVLRGLAIEGLGIGSSGISFNSGGTLIVENVAINNFANRGIDVATSSASTLVVTDSVIRNNPLGGIHLHPSGSVSAILDNVRLEKNVFGLRADANSSATVRHSTFAKNTGNGVFAINGLIDVESSLISGSTNAVNCQSGTIRLSNTTLFQNTIGINNMATVLTFGNNHNTSPNSGTAPVAAPAGGNF